MIILLLAALTLVSSCEKSEDFGKGPAYTVDLDQCIDPSIKGTRINICFDELIEDSRCPANMMCIWQGRAVARFSFSVKGKDHVLTLGTFDMPDYSKDTVVSGYRVELVDVNPYPGLPANPSEKTRAEVKITKP